MLIYHKNKKGKTMNEEFVEFTGERIIPELENFFF